MITGLKKKMEAIGDEFVIFYPENVFPSIDFAYCSMRKRIYINSAAYYIIAASLKKIKLA